MKLLPFNKELRYQLMEKGYRNIEIKRVIEGEYSWLPDEKSLQILKALYNADAVSAHSIENINSLTIDALLDNPNIHSFIIVESQELF
ncbi:MAG: hypothetical protein ACTHJ0_00850 [Flavipsychrobacter sp.]